MKDANIAKDRIKEVVLVGGSIRIPAVKQLVKGILGREPNESVNPDEVVAMGAAIQGGVLSGEKGTEGLLLLDVTPLSLGVETLGGVMTKIITRNTTIPTKKSETFSTAVDGQSNVEIHVLQGEREMSSDNKSLGTFRLDGIPAAPRGVPQVEVTFDIDANGILSVTAKDKGTGKEQTISITGASTLDKTEVEKMVRDAEMNSSSDKDKRERIDLKNQADSLAYQSEKQMNDLGDKVSAEDKARIEGMVKELRDEIQAENFDAIASQKTALEQALYQITTNLYQQSSGEAGATDANPAATNGPAPDDVIDADFTETK